MLGDLAIDVTEDALRDPALSVEGTLFEVPVEGTLFEGDPSRIQQQRRSLESWLALALKQSPTVWSPHLNRLRAVVDVHGDENDPAHAQGKLPRVIRLDMQEDPDPAEAQQFDETLREGVARITEMIAVLERSNDPRDREDATAMLERLVRLATTGDFPTETHILLRSTGATLSERLRTLTTRRAERS